MTDPAHIHAKPEALPLQDARKHIACAQTALAAAVHHRPDLGQHLDVVHAVLGDQLRELERIGHG